MGYKRGLRRLGKKGSDLISENTVVAILFLILTVVVLVILVNWWKAYNSRGTIPAIKSLDILQRNVNLLEPGADPRLVPLQTQNYEIKSFTDPYVCGEDKEKKPYNCLCVCESSSSCEMAYKTPEDNCRVIKYEARFSINSDVIKNYRVYLVKEKEDYFVNATLNG